MVKRLRQQEKSAEYSAISDMVIMTEISFEAKKLYKVLKTLEPKQKFPRYHQLSKKKSQLFIFGHVFSGSSLTSKAINDDITMKTNLIVQTIKTTSLKVLKNLSSNKVSRFTGIVYGGRTYTTD